jgi:hypothetical protein
MNPMTISFRCLFSEGRIGESVYCAIDEDVFFNNVLPVSGVVKERKAAGNEGPPQIQRQNYMRKSEKHDFSRGGGQSREVSLWVP